jgi:hypothetical protein
MKSLTGLCAVSLAIFGCGSSGGGGGDGGAGGQAGTAGSGGFGAFAGTAGTGATAGSAGTAGGGGAAWQLGDGSPASVSFVELYKHPSAIEATDLDFNPARPGELWAALRPLYQGLPCTSEVQQGCASLEGSVAIITNAPTDATTEWKQDGNAWHFMRRPTAIAFGPGDTFATCGEALTGNFEDSPVDYNGPTLWSSDPEIFAKTHGVPPGHNFTPNGAHLDMLHGTPLCMGIAHQVDNVYWCFNGQIGALDKYDFKEPHPPGGDDHSDGEMYRYIEGQIARLDEVPSGMALAPDGWLYIADSGNGRVIRVDTSSGSISGDVVVQDNFAVKKRVDGATVEEVIPAGIFSQPSGLALDGDVLFVSDHASGAIHAADLSGNAIRSLDTGRGPGGVAGLAIGPQDGKLYFVDKVGGAVYRIDP